jgi:hypothetical protein
MRTIETFPIEEMTKDLLDIVNFHSNYDQLKSYVGPKELFKVEATETMPTLYYVKEAENAYSVHAVDTNIIKFNWMNSAEPGPVPPTPPTPEPTEFTSEYITDIHEGTADYGESADPDPVDQNSNQDKLTINPYDLGDEKFIELKGNLDELQEWTSTNPSQQDAKHKWFALDFVFSAEQLEEGIIWCGDTELTPDVLDPDEGPNTLTLWLKIDQLAESDRVITLESKGTDSIKESITIKFVPKN